jgi:hypothetical protein
MREVQVNPLRRVILRGTEEDTVHRGAHAQCVSTDELD